MSTRVSAEHTVRDLGVIFDSRLTMADHVAAVCRSGSYQLRQLHPVVRSLSADGAKTVVHAFISSRLDCCNSLLTGVADCLLRRLQSLQDAAAPPVTGAPRREHITPILSNFIGYQYVSVFHTSWKSWYSDHYQARRRRILPTIASTLLNPDGGHSDQRNDPSASYNAATRSFVVAGARAWNNLPASLRNTELTMDTFCKHLKNCFVY